MASRFLLSLLILALAPLAAAESRFSRHGVDVDLRIEDDGRGGGALVARFVPREQADPLHLYDLDLPADAVGVATRLELPPGSPLSAVGPLAADRAPVAKSMAGFAVSIYPPGPVVLRLPVRWPAGNGASLATQVLVSYMACTDDACLIPVQRQPVMVVVPTVAGAVPPDAAARQWQARLDEQAALLTEERTARRRIQAEVAALQDRLDALVRGRAGIPWRQPGTPAEVESLIRTAHAEGKAALIDVTGPTCLNCQVLKKTVFILPEVAAAWNSGVPISIDTDRYPELATWQRERFGTETRPLQVHLAPGVTPSPQVPMWSAMVDPGDPAEVAAYAAFLTSGTGADATGDEGWAAFLLLAVVGGLVTLLMPCTYPMIPFTLGFFAKQAAAGRRTLPLALAYGVGLIACFAGLGLVIVGVFGTTLAAFAGSPWTNLAIAVLFVVFGLSLLGAFLLQLPSGWLDRLGGGRSGYAGALVMGLVFAATAFTCVAPFAGAVLSGADVDGSWGRAVLGMAVYGATIAVPFVVLALVPGWTAHLPRSRGWMNEVKVVGGIVELAAALKFIAYCDLVWGWDVFGRTLILVLWAGAAILLAAYALGLWRWDGDGPVDRVGPVRLCMALGWLALGIWLAAGVGGLPLGWVEGLFPANAPPGA
jgi:thiol:disulfide interchange protein